MEEENEEEFLSPESESEHESDDDKDQSKPENPSEGTDNNPAEKTEVVKNSDVDCTDKSSNLEYKDSVKDKNDIESSDNVNTQSEDKVVEGVLENSKKDEIEEKLDENQSIETEKPKGKEEETVGEAIEEPVMVVKGEGNGADCESGYFFGEEISEPVMYFYGDGYGIDNDTGNTEAIKESQDNNTKEDENPPEECNGETHDVPLPSKKKKLKSVKLKNKIAVNKRSLKKKPNDSIENLKTSCKKHCVRDMDKSNGSNSNSHDDSKRDSSINDKNTTDCENVNKNRKKKLRGKIKKKKVVQKVKANSSKEPLNSVSESDNCQNNKNSIIEKRKSSLSSEQEEENSDNEKEKSPNKAVNNSKPEDDLPPKKLRLAPSSEFVNVQHSNDSSDHKDEPNSQENNENDNSNTNVLADPLSSRKKIKARKGKFKKKIIVKKNEDHSDRNSDVKKSSKAVKRSLLNANACDKSESQSESEEEEVVCGKRQKTKPKKINTSSR